MTTPIPIRLGSDDSREAWVVAFEGKSERVVEAVVFDELADEGKQFLDKRFRKRDLSGDIGLSLREALRIDDGEVVARFVEAIRTAGT